MKKITNSYRETQTFGEEFAKNLAAGDKILLFGNLGAGKTTFMQGLAKGLGIQRRIISPTFIIVRRYVIANEVKQSNTNSEIATSQAPRNDIHTLYHIDLYRTKTDDDLQGLGMDEILQDKDAITAVEWPEKLGVLMPRKTLPAGRQVWELRFEDLGENTRSITMEKK